MAGSQTKGSFRINRGFNPSKDPKIDEIKEKAGELVDLIEEIDSINLADDIMDEVNRLKAIAQTHFETGAMFGVKAQAMSKSWQLKKS